MNTPSEIKKPAIGLLVGGIFLAVIALVTLLMMIGNRVLRDLMGALSYVYGFYVYGLALLAMSVFAVLGAVSMIKGRGYGMAMTGAICSIVGGVLTGLPGWILVLPMGIWAFVALRRPAVKTLLKRDSTHPQTPS